MTSVGLLQAFDAAKNHAYLTALHLFNSNAYDVKVPVVLE